MDIKDLKKQFIYNWEKAKQCEKEEDKEGYVHYVKKSEEILSAIKSQEHKDRR